MTFAKFMILSQYAVAQLAQALRHKPEDRGFVSRRGHWDFLWLDLYGRTMTLRSTHSITEMNTWLSSERRGGGKGGPWLRLTIFPPTCADIYKFWESHSTGEVRDCQVCNGITLSFMTLHFLKSRWKCSNKINKKQVKFIINNQTPVRNQKLQSGLKFTNTESSQHECIFCNLHKFQLNTNMTESHCFTVHFSVQ